MPYLAELVIRRAWIASRFASISPLLDWGTTAHVYPAFEIEILKGVVSQDHVHVLLSAPPNLAPSEIMRRIKGRSSMKLFESFPDLKMRYWDVTFGHGVTFA